ncbi:hypothetical protein GE061_002422 [Apolygus lucorum]|uniref:PID domain-containing protein n=1 Tax=Apolygus lucorum TaxID=248454 RepID=A0A8S9X519_APOLU|nr:hypothetical protein GE061_002422 [Apolygus lucorum]
MNLLFTAQELAEIFRPANAARIRPLKNRCSENPTTQEPPKNENLAFGKAKPTPASIPLAQHAAPTPMQYATNGSMRVVRRRPSSFSATTTAGHMTIKRISPLRNDTQWKLTEGEKMSKEVMIEELPQTFTVKYLGCREARGLWGIKHTRAPVDSLVSAAKTPGALPPALMSFTVTSEGCTLHSPTASTRKSFPIEVISYGVQDLLYTRVFSMIVVRDAGDPRNPFECHGFVCESRQSARRLTYCLATAFQEYSKRVRLMGQPRRERLWDPPKFAIDLRTPEEIEAEMRTDSEA